MAKAYWTAVYSLDFRSGRPGGIRQARRPGNFGRRRPVSGARECRQSLRGRRAQRVVLIEFESVERAVAAHESEGYQAALKALGKAAERDLRIVEGLAS